MKNLFSNAVRFSVIAIVSTLMLISMITFLNISSAVFGINLLGLFMALSIWIVFIVLVAYIDDLKMGIIGYCLGFPLNK